MKTIWERRSALKDFYKVIYKKETKKFLKKYPNVGYRFLKNFEELAKDFHQNYKNFDINVYNSISNAFRMRIGDYRAIFLVKETEIKIIEVIKIDSRGSSYKK